MKRIPFILVLFFQIAILVAQELPPIITYSPEDYFADNQNWMISQSTDKTIYVANTSGLLEFNGSEFKLYVSPNRSVLRSVKVINELIYTGCFMEFGYWEKDGFGNLNYTSLIPKLKEPLLDDEHFWNILEVDHWVLFQSLDRIYSYNTIDESFKIIDSEINRAQIFKVGQEVFFQKSDNNLYKIVNGSPELVSNDPVLKNNIIIGVYKADDKTLVLLEKDGFYFLEEKDIRKWRIPADTELAKVNIFSSTRLNDGSFVLGTISDGMYHIARDGTLKIKINKENGLYNNTVLSTFEDLDNNLWLGLDHGLSVINLNPQFTEYNDLKGEVGNVYAAILFNNQLYIGTNQGLFYKTTENTDSFELIEGTQGQVWSLTEIDDTLFCGHNNGTYVISNNKAELISDFPGTWKIEPVVEKEDLLLQGSYNGLSILEKTNGNWRLRNKLSGFDYSSRFFEQINGHEIIVNNEYKGIFKLKVDSLYTELISTENNPANGFGSSLIKYNNDFIYTVNTDRKILKYNNNKHDFETDSVLTDIFYDEDDSLQGILIPDKSGNRFWGFTLKNIQYITPSTFSDTHESLKIAIPESFRRSLGVAGFEYITYLKENQYLIGGTEGYTLFRLEHQRTTEFSIHIKAAYKEYLNSPNVLMPLNGEIELPFNQNNIGFSFSVPVYDKYAEVNYQYQLLGDNDQWVDLSQESKVSFENLRFGDYTFNVRASIGELFSQNTASYSFEIKRPWYFSNLAILGYFLCLLALSFTVHKIYKSYYKKQQALILEENRRKARRKKLKSKKKIVQINNEKLRIDIAGKNRELAISTMSIIKKNEFLKSIKDQLKEVENTPEVKSVIKTINRNINNSDDWKFFEEAFNNADKDFLKKVKGAHPELTPNDLKLCAYLKLNLSSKEIAPLLNISVRSVEVKRYRLRKKMALPHDSGLSEYILNL